MAGSSQVFDPDHGGFDSRFPLLALAQRWPVNTWQPAGSPDAQPAARERKGFPCLALGSTITVAWLRTICETPIVKAAGRQDVCAASQMSSIPPPLTPSPFPTLTLLTKGLPAVFIPTI